MHHPNPSDQVKATHLAIEEIPWKPPMQPQQDIHHQVWKQNKHNKDSVGQVNSNTSNTPANKLQRLKISTNPQQIKTNKQDIAKQDHYNKSAQHES